MMSADAYFERLHLASVWRLVEDILLVMIGSEVLLASSECKSETLINILLNIAHSLSQTPILATKYYPV